MPLTPREAFKVGFLLKCADDGLSPEGVQERVTRAVALVEKHASVADIFSQPIKDLQGARTVSDIMRKGLPSYVLWGMPPALGIAGGYAAHKLRGEPVEAEDVKNRELIEEYRRWTDRAKDWKQHKALLPH